MIAGALRHAWSAWTADPVDQAGWSAENPARGQCASTALTVQDLFGGELLMAEVAHADGSRQGVHYWNRLAGTELDLTREQFRAGERIGAPQEVPRAPDVTRGRLAGNYHLLRVRLERELSGTDAPARERPVTIKGVVRDSAGRVLLGQNDRGEWELPGGRPEVGEPFGACLIRELAEEAGIDVAPDGVIAAQCFEAIPGHWVDVVAFRATVTEPIELRLSDEHTAIAFLDPATLGPDSLPAVYRALIGRA